MQNTPSKCVDRTGESAQSPRQLLLYRPPRPLDSLLRFDLHSIVYHSHNSNVKPSTAEWSQMAVRVSGSLCFESQLAGFPLISAELRASKRQNNVGIRNQRH